MSSSSILKVPVKSAGGVGILALSPQTFKLLHNIFNRAPEPSDIAPVVESVLEKARGEGPLPFLRDVELAIISDMNSSALFRGSDLSRVKEAATAWNDAFDVLTKPAARGVGLLSRLVRLLMDSTTQDSFVRAANDLIDGALDKQATRGLTIEFMKEVTERLIDLHENGGDMPAEANYLDNHVFYNLYEGIIVPVEKAKGRALVLRRLHILLRLLVDAAF